MNNPMTSAEATRLWDKARALLKQISECPKPMCGHCIEVLFEEAEPAIVAAHNLAVLAARCEQAEKMVSATENMECPELHEWQKEERDRLRREMEEMQK